MSSAVPLAAALLWTFSDFHTYNFIIPFSILTVTLLISSSTLHSLLAIICSVSALSVIGAIPFISDLIIEESADRSIILLVSILMIVILLLEKIDAPSSEIAGIEPMYRILYKNIFPTLIMFIFTIPFHVRSNSKALNLLANAEDNSAWLQGMYGNLNQQGHLIYGSSSGFSAGKTLGGVYLIAQFAERCFRLEPSGYSINGLTLLHIYGITTGLIIATATAAAIRVLANSLTPSLRYITVYAVLISIISYAFCASIILSGHLAFLVAFWLLLGAIVLTTLFRFTKTSLFLGGIILLAIPGTWPPLSPLILICIAASLTSHHRSGNWTLYLTIPLGFRKIIRLLVPAMLTGWLINSIVGRVTRSGLDISGLSVLVSLGGGTVAPSPRFSAAVLILGLILFVLPPRDFDDRFRNPIVASSAIIFLFCIYLSSFLLGVHVPQYAARKTGLLVIGVLLIAIIIFLPQRLNLQGRKKNSLTILALIFLSFLADGSIASSLRYPFSQNSTTRPWVDVALNETQLYPDRQIICLPVSELDDTSSYLCNRIVMGLQGTVPIRNIDLWSALGFYMNDATPFEALPLSFYNSITFLTASTGRPTNTNPNVATVFESIPWNIVRLVHY
jgi:hypothetical protein